MAKSKMPLVYDNEDCNKFVKRMVKANIKVQHYRGRFFWEGPAACTNYRKGITEADVRKAAKMKLQHDGMGRDDIIMYPIHGGKLIEDNTEEFYKDDEE